MSDRIVVSIAEDGLLAVVSVSIGPEAGRDDLLTAIGGAGVTYGIDDAEVQSLARALTDSEFTASKRVVARGRPATPSRDAAIELCIDPGLRAATVDSHGRLDYRARGLITRVAKGQQLARISAAVEGAAGRRVDGNAIEVKPPKPRRIGVGDGASHQTGEVVATRDGAVVYRSDPYFDVVDFYEHRGDVDLRSGDLEMLGAVVVAGDVTRGFMVRATGDVEVKGRVASGMVLSDAAVQICGGVTGGSTGRIIAGRSLSVHHAEGAVLLSGDRIDVEGDVIGGQLIARAVRIQGKARTADVRAETEIELGEAGMPNGSELVLAAAVPLQPLPEEVARASLAAARVRRRSRARVGNRIGSGRARPRGSKASRDNIPLEKARTRERVAMRRRQQQLARAASVEIRGALHPGVVVKIGTIAERIESPTRGVRIRADVENGRLCREVLS